MSLQPQSIQDFPTLLKYLRDVLDWPFYEDNWEDNAFDENPEGLGIDSKHAVQIKSLRQLRPSEEAGPWGIFYLEFEAKRLPVVVLRRILRALVPRMRQSANAAERRVWNCNDLLFICAGGELSHRALTFAHFRAIDSHHVAQLRTFGWDEREQSFYSLQNLNLNRLSWDHQDDWAAAFTAEHGRTIKDARALATSLAHFARRTKYLALELLKLERADGKLHQLHRAFQKSLLSDLDEAQFADTIAQTVAYGLFAGRATGRKLSSLGLADLGGMIPETNPFLRELFREFVEVSVDLQTHHVDFDDLGVVELVEFLNEVEMENVLADFGRQSGGGGQDPVIHFYETFLKEYDARARIQRGVYYTPKPVVDFIVRGVDHLLRTELDCPLGLADATQDEAGNYRVCILDPATGTGTFLVSVIETIYETMCGEWKKAGQRPSQYAQLWDEYVSQYLLPRLHGFELMMASYTVAHLKIGLKLSELGYKPKVGERLRVFLTNTLEETQQLSLDLPEFLSHESREAQKVKNETQVTVVVGNPPYAGHSANEGVWIRHLLHSKLEDGADSFFKVDGADLGERNPKWLNDDYVKFTRYAQHRIARSGHGVMGFITNHGYLDNPTFRGMRQSLASTFEAMWQLDLHGNAKKKEKSPDGRADENVFEIQQGVSLNFGVRGALSKIRRHEPRVQHADLWGTQDSKYLWLRTKAWADVAWSAVQPNKPSYLFVPQDSEVRAEYERGTKITEIFPTNSLGIATARDAFCVQSTREEIWKVVRDFVKLPPEAARTKYSLGKDARDWQVKLAQADLKRTGPSEKHLAPLLYRPFDLRWTYYTGNSRGFLCMPRDDVMKHVVARKNLGLSTTRNIEIERGFEHVFISDALIQLHTVSIKEVNYLFPLYLYNPPLNLDTLLLGTGEDGRRANLAPAFVAQLGAALNLRWVSDGRGDASTCIGPEDVLAYIYALFHAPSYRTRYGEFLKIDFPRVPLTSDAALFWQLVERGRGLIKCHLLDGVVAATGPTPKGEVAAGYPKFADGRVQINASAGFDGVAESVWNFHIGGYQVAHKWLKDRKGRALSDADAAHYRQVLVVLQSTLDAMQAIDDIIAAHGGWPLADSQDVAALSPEDVKAFFVARGDASHTPSPKPKTSTIASRQQRMRPEPPTASRSIADFSRDDLIEALLSAMEPRSWHEREDVLIAAARNLGFSRVGKNIRAAFKSAFTSAIRRGRLEHEGSLVRRKSGC